ncbi:hypothetical protein EDB84DRAFT_1439791 [Lactarius hengduanensis]|nr:hypothetical protein EDB84DRAFT_1439791 [Lactarius hengduanensis]
MAMSPSPKPSRRDARASPSPSGQRNLTPQRKHRKMLKDGTSEVWPESVEKIFVDGLRQYWESPWATYSRGRSRWRNQFLVDYLKEAGIERSKKQVASHIQVLRNMWKGEKEYQLVAGGEELFQENGLLAHKPSLSRIAQPDVSVKEEQKDGQSPFPRRTPSDSGDFPSESDNMSLEPLHPLDVSTDRIPGAFLAPLPLGHPSHPRSSLKDEGFDLTLPFPSTLSSSSSFMASSVSPPLLVRNSVTAILLSAAGMQPLVVNVSRSASPSPLLPSYPSHASIHIKLSLSSLHDVASPPTLHGFSGTVTFAAPWASVAQCTTRLYAGGVCESIEQAYFDPVAPLSPVSMTPVTAPLPESSLSSCRWGSIGVDIRIIQQIIVDNEELACITYDLTRTANGPPTAEVVREGQGQHLAAPVPAPAATALSESVSFLSLGNGNWNSGASYAQYAPYVPRSQEPRAMYSPYTSFGSSSSYSDSAEQQYIQTQYTPSVLFS